MKRIGRIITAAVGATVLATPGQSQIREFDGVPIDIQGDPTGRMWEGNQFWIVFMHVEAADPERAKTLAQAGAVGAMQRLLITRALYPKQTVTVKYGWYLARGARRYDLIVPMSVGSQMTTPTRLDDGRWFVAIRVTADKSKYSLAYIRTHAAPQKR